MERAGSDAAIRAIARGQHSLVARRQLRAAGVAAPSVRRRLRSGMLVAVTSRVLRLAGAAPDEDQRVMAAVLDAGPGAVASHTTAAALWGLPGFDGATVEVSRGRAGSDRPSSLARVHHPRLLPAAHCAVLRAVPVTTLVRTVFDVAGQVHEARAERALQAALRRGLSWSVVERHLAETAEHGRDGIAVLRVLLDRHRGKPVLGSGLEARFLRLVRAAGLPEPARQVDVGAQGWVARVDFLYHDARLVIEIDGNWSHTSPLDIARDKRRTAGLVAAGYAVLPISEELLRADPQGVVRLVREARGAAAARSGGQNATVSALVRGPERAGGYRRAATTL